MGEALDSPPPSPPPGILLTLSDVVSLTRVSKRKLQMEMAAGSLPYVKIGRSVRLLPSDVNAYVQSRRIQHRRNR